MSNKKECKNCPFDNSISDVNDFNHDVEFESIDFAFPKFDFSFLDIPKTPTDKLISLLENLRGKKRIPKKTKIEAEKLFECIFSTSTLKKR